VGYKRKGVVQTTLPPTSLEGKKLIYISTLFLFLLLSQHHYGAWKIFMEP
jgi:hypothetical protein